MTLVSFPGFAAALLFALIATSASAEVIFDSGVLAFAASSTQAGRLSRNGISSDWANAKAFPGTVGGAGIGYQLFTVDSGIYEFLQISFDDTAARLFVSAYDGAYSGPVATGYLGDPGASQPFGNSSFFQIVVQRHTPVAFVINEINAGFGVGAPFQLFVEGFFDTEYNDITTEPDPGGGGSGTGNVPEPTSLALMGAGLVCFARYRRTGTRGPRA